MLEEIVIAESGHISAVYYDEELMTLYIEFDRGQVYSYHAVPGNIARGFSQALSAGQYFHAQIRNQFEFKKLG